MVATRPNLKAVSDSDPKFIDVPRTSTRMSQLHKWSMLSVMCDLGAHDLGKKKRDVLIAAVVKTASYYNGYQAPALATRTMTNYWLKYRNSLGQKPQELHLAMHTGKLKKPKKTYVDVLCTMFPRLLHRLYRYVTSVLGCSAKTSSLVHVMNQKSSVTYPRCPIRSRLKLTKHHFWVFFKKFKGKLLRPTTKPRLTEEQKSERVDFAKFWLSKLDAKDEDLNYCFLDEKWFYTTS